MGSLEHHQLQQIKASLQKFFYTAGTNIAFYNAYQDPKTTQFREKLSKAIHKQILHIASVDKIDEIGKTSKKAVDWNVVAAVGLLWMALEDAWPGGEAGTLSYLHWAGERGGESGLDKMIPPPHTFNLRNLE